MTDRQKTELAMTPRDLYVKSNPGLLGTGTDITNPRDWYCSVATRQLLKTFVSQYNNIQNEKLTGESPTKKVAFYVNFPSFIKEQPLGVRDKASLQREATTLPREDWTDEHVHLEEDVPTALSFPHRDYPEQLKLRQESSVSNLVRMPSFSHLLPLIETEPQEKKAANKEHSLISVSLPKLSTRTVTLSIGGKDRDGPYEREKTWKKWLSRMPNEVHNARSYLLQGQIQRTKLGNLVTQSDVALNPRAETLDGNSGAVARAIPNEYVELLLPKHQAELIQSQDFHDTYTWHQKSVLNLKLNYTKNKKHKSTSALVLKENSSEHKPTSRKIKKVGLGLLQSAQGGHHSRSNSGGNKTLKGDMIGFYPQPHDLTIEPATFHPLTKYPLSQEKNPRDSMVLAAEGVSNADVGTSDNHSNTTPRYIYKAPGDGFLRRPAKPSANPTPSIVTLGLEGKQIAEKGPLSPRQQGTTLAHAASQPDLGEVNRTGHEGNTLSSESASRSGRSHFLQTYTHDPQARSVLRKYKTLEVFAERRDYMATTEPEQSTSDEDQTTLVKNKSYKPILRAPSFRIDERDYSAAGVSREVTQYDAVKASKITKFGFKGPSLNINIRSPLIRDESMKSMSDPCLLIERVNLDAERVDCDENDLHQKR